MRRLRCCAAGTSPSHIPDNILAISSSHLSSRTRSTVFRSLLELASSIIRTFSALSLICFSNYTRLNQLFRICLCLGFFQHWSDYVFRLLLELASSITGTDENFALTIQNLWQLGLNYLKNVKEICLKCLISALSSLSMCVIVKPWKEALSPRRH